MRWCLQLQEYNFDVQHRAGTQKVHIDALSWNAVEGESVTAKTNSFVMRMETADWVLSAQLTDDKLRSLQEILRQYPKDDYEKTVQDYCVEDNRKVKSHAFGSCLDA